MNTQTMFTNQNLNLYFSGSFDMMFNVTNQCTISVAMNTALINQLGGIEIVITL